MSSELHPLTENVLGTLDAAIHNPANLSTHKTMAFSPPSLHSSWPTTTCVTKSCPKVLLNRTPSIGHLIEDYHVALLVQKNYQK